MVCVLCPLSHVLCPMSTVQKNICACACSMTAAHSPVMCAHLHALLINKDRGQCVLQPHVCASAPYADACHSCLESIVCYLHCICKLAMTPFVHACVGGIFLCFCTVVSELGCGRSAPDACAVLHRAFVSDDDAGDDDMPTPPPPVS